MPSVARLSHPSSYLLRLSRRLAWRSTPPSPAAMHSTMTPAPAAVATKSVPSTAANFSTLHVNGPRLMETLHSTCEFGKAHAYGEHPTETGMARLALNDDDKKVRQWFVEQVEALGCTVTVDQMGNIFAVRPGKVNNVPPVMMGSHLDTQPTGGRYDGILGVMAGLEALRTLHDNNYETQGPVGIVNWTNEEGARFPIVTVSSAVWAGSIPLETGWNCREVPSLATGPTLHTIKEELERIGFLGSVPASYEAQPMAAHFELHIEQGPILEDEVEKVGVVTGAQAYNWYEVEIVGRDSHAGTTPLAARKDAMLAAAKMMVASNKIASEASGLITTGIINAHPGSVNTLPRVVKFTLDARHPSDEKLAGMVASCREAFDKIAKEDSGKGVEVKWTTLTENTAVEFHPDCIAAVEAAAIDATRGLPGAQDRKLYRRMLSGAGHDSCHASKRCPTSMVFTPTRDGMSHTPDEYCSPEDCVIGAQVLMGAALRYDASRKL